MPKCKSCGAEIFFLKTSRGKIIPVNSETISEQDKLLIRKNQTVYFDYKIHTAHFATCPDSERFRRKIK